MGVARLRSVLLLGASAAVLVTASASAQADPKPMHVGAPNDWGTVDSGATYEVEGRGYPAGQTVRLRIAASESSPVEVDTARDGTFSTDFRVPPDTPAGPTRAIACVEDRSGGCANAAFASLVVRTPAPTTTAARPTTTAGTPGTSPPTTVPGDVGVGTTSSSTSLPGDLGVTSTTVEGSPPGDPNPDPDGLAVTTTTTQPPLVADIPETVPNLVLTDIEVTQTLQDLENRFPLVAGRRTAVRVYGIAEGDDPQGGITAAIQVLKVEGGEETELGILYDENTTPITFDDALHRSDNAYTPYFHLPYEWAHGTLRIRAYAFAYDPSASNEPTAADNMIDVTVTFDEGRPVHLYYFPLHLTEDNDPDGAQLTVHPQDEWLPQQLHFYRQLPVPAVVGHPMSTVVGDGSSDWDLSEESENTGAPLTALLEMHALDEKADNHHYVGLVHPSVPTKFGGLAKGYGKPVAWVKWWSGFDNNSPWRHWGGAILAHELGHNMGISHAPCKFQVGDGLPGELEGGAVDPTFPGLYGFPACTLAPTDARGYYGFDVIHTLSEMGEPAVLSNHGSAETPNLAYPFMGYRAPGWTDPWHGCMVLQFVDVSCDQSSLEVKDESPDAPNSGGIPTPGVAVPNFSCDEFTGEDGADLCDLQLDQGYDPTASEPQPSDGFLLVSGVVNTKTGTAVIDGVLTVEGTPTEIEPDLDGDPSGGGPYVLVLRDASGRIAWMTTLDVDEPTQAHGGGVAGDEVFVAKVPALASLGSVELVTADGVLATKGPAGDGPQVGDPTARVGDALEVQVPALDPDGDPVRRYLQYRPGAGSPWITVAAGLAGDAFTGPLTDLPASGDGQLRILATDGWTTTAATVDGLVVPEQPPQVSVAEPLDGASVPHGRPLALQAQALDATDGLIERIEWRSDVDGELGRGTHTSVTSLSAGRHVLTAAATDSAGETGEASVQVTVTDTDLPPSDVTASVADVFGAGAAVPASDDGDASLLLWLALGVVAVGLAGSGMFLLGRRTRRTGPPSP